MTEKEKELWEKVYFEALFGDKLIPDPAAMAMKAVEDQRSAMARLLHASRQAGN